MNEGDLKDVIKGRIKELQDFNTELYSLKCKSPTEEYESRLHTMMQMVVAQIEILKWVLNEIRGDKD